MHFRRDPILRALLCFAFSVHVSGQFSESESFLRFVRSLDPPNHLRIKGLASNPCLSQWKGIKCHLNTTSIVEISLNNMNLTGIIDTNSLCNLPNLRLLNLAKNHIRGNIDATISGCTNLRYLNLSGNLLNGTVPLALYKLKNLKLVDVSDNHLTYKTNVLKRYSGGSTQWHARIEVKAGSTERDDASAPSPSSGPHHDLSGKRTTHHFDLWSEVVLSVALLAMLAVVVNMTITKSLKEKKILKDPVESSPKTSPVQSPKEVKQEEIHPGLVFFVEEEEQFKLEHLFEAGADMQNQNLCSSLYKVQLSNNVAYAVKRLKKLQVSNEEFDRTMAKVGKLNHPNILPLVAYHCEYEEKLLIYRYQNKGSLLKQMKRYIEGKRDFPWKLRVSIVAGIARGLDSIYRSFEGSEIIPHGNMKLSNILLNENEEPLISEYGYSHFLDHKSVCILGCNGYTAPERCLSEQGDVFSFGVILLELLTGKIVENSGGLDLPKWVRAMVREEWTGEVFDKEVAKVGMYAFPLLNISLKCVAHFAENRPAMAEVLEKIEEVVNAQEDFSFSSMDSTPHSQDDGHVLYPVAEES